MINVINLMNMTEEDGEMRTDMVTPLVSEDYVATMLSPIVPMPSAAGNLLATFTYQVRSLQLN